MKENGATAALQPKLAATAALQPKLAMVEKEKGHEVHNTVKEAVERPRLSLLES